MPRKPPAPPPATDVAVLDKPSTEVVSYKDRMAALVTQTKRAETPRNGRISFKNSQMSINGTRMPNDTIRAIIVEYRMDNEFYPEAYELGKPQAPVCHAVVRPWEYQSPWRALRKGETTDTFEHWDATLQLGTESADPQVEAGRGCDSCSLLEFGSAKIIKGKAGPGKGKACRESRHVNLFAADQCTTPGDISRAPYMTMIPPPTSLVNFQKFANQVTQVLGKPIFGAVVDISVVPHPKYLFEVQYMLISPIHDDGLMNALLLRHEQLNAREIIMPKQGDDEATKDARGTKF